MAAAEGPEGVRAMEQMLKRIPVKVGNIPWRNNNLSTLHAEPPLSEQGETFIGIYLLALGRSAMVVKNSSVFQMEEGCSSVLMSLLHKTPLIKR